MLLNSHYVLQSAFRKGHSNVTVLLQILANIFSNISPTLCCQLVLHESICSFDSLRHDIPISRLDMIGIDESTLKWLKTYILNRAYSV